MKNHKWLLSIIAGIAVAGALIAWLVLSGDKPVNIKLNNGVSAQLNASLKNSILNREKDGKKLWEFVVDEVINDRQKNTAYLKGIKGKVYRSDGSYIDVIADKGSAALSKNDFVLEGHVKAILNTGGELYADKVTYYQSKEIIIGKGHVKAIKDGWTATADEAETTSALKKIKMKGHAKVEKGGEKNAL